MKIKLKQTALEKAKSSRQKNDAMHVDDVDTDSGTDNQKPAAVQKDQPRECHD